MIAPRSTLQCSAAKLSRPSRAPSPHALVPPPFSLTIRTRLTPHRTGVPGAAPKKKIVSKASSGVELEYAKKVDVYNYKSGTTALPGHGASY